MPTETTDDRPDAAARAARLAMHRTGAVPCSVDGGWWPRSRSAADELPCLVRALEQRFGPVAAITLNSAKWADIPRHVIADGRTVRLEWTVTVDPDLAVVATERGPLKLLVIPPSCARAVAEESLAEVWQGTNRPPAAIIARC